MSAPGSTTSAAETQPQLLGTSRFASIASRSRTLTKDAFTPRDLADCVFWVAVWETRANSARRAPSRPTVAPARSVSGCLDVTQRRKLLANSKGGIRRLVEAVMHTGCRAGELTSARRSAFDARTKSLNVTGKTGSRTIPLTPASVALFAQFAKDKMPTAFLLTRDDGTPWAHSSWDVLVKEPRRAPSCRRKPVSIRWPQLHHPGAPGRGEHARGHQDRRHLACHDREALRHLVADTARARLAKVQLV